MRIPEPLVYKDAQQVTSGSWLPSTRYDEGTGQQAGPLDQCFSKLSICLGVPWRMVTTQPPGSYSGDPDSWRLKSALIYALLMCSHVVQKLQGQGPHAGNHCSSDHRTKTSTWELQVLQPAVLPVTEGLHTKAVIMELGSSGSRAHSIPSSK